jgi:chromosome segregation ATPase
MFSFGKAKEELKVCKAALEKRLSELRHATADQADLQEKLNTANAQAEAYKTDNLTLISRVAHLQEAMNESLRQFQKQSDEYSALQDTVHKLLEAVEKAKAKKKKKNGKKKRK